MGALSCNSELCATTFSKTTTNSGKPCDSGLASLAPWAPDTGGVRLRQHAAVVRLPHHAEHRDVLQQHRSGLPSHWGRRAQTSPATWPFGAVVGTCRHLSGRVGICPDRSGSVGICGDLLGLSTGNAWTRCPATPAPTPRAPRGRCARPSGAASCTAAHIQKLCDVQERQGGRIGHLPLRYATQAGRPGLLDAIHNDHLESSATPSEDRRHPADPSRGPEWTLGSGASAEFTINA